MTRFFPLADFYQPLKEDDLEQSTIVQIIFPAEAKPVRILLVVKNQGSFFLSMEYFAADLVEYVDNNG